MSKFEIAALEFEIKVERKLGTSCEGDLRAGRTKIEYTGSDKRALKIDAKGPSKPAIPPKPETKVAKENDFVQRAPDFDGWSPISFVTPAGKKPKWGGAPQGFGLHHPGVRFGESPHYYDDYIEEWEARFFRDNGKRKLSSMDLEFIGPFYCWCKKTNKYLVRLIRLTFKFDGNTHPAIKIEQSEEKAVDSPFAKLTTFKKVVTTQSNSKKAIGKTNWRYSEVKGLVQIGCPCESEDGSGEKGADHKADNGEKSGSPPKSAPEKTEDEAPDKKVQGDAKDDGTFETNVRKKPCEAIVHVSYLFSDPKRTKKKGKGKSKKKK